MRRLQFVSDMFKYHEDVCFDKPKIYVDKIPEQVLNIVKAGQIVNYDNIPEEFHPTGTEVTYTSEFGLKLSNLRSNGDKYTSAKTKYVAVIEGNCLGVGHTIAKNPDEFTEEDLALVREGASVECRLVDNWRVHDTFNYGEGSIQKGAGKFTYFAADKFIHLKEDLGVVGIECKLEKIDDPGRKSYEGVIALRYLNVGSNSTSEFELGFGSHGTVSKVCGVETSYEDFLNSSEAVEHIKEMENFPAILGEHREEFLRSSERILEGYANQIKLYSLILGVDLQKKDFNPLDVVESMLSRYVERPRI